MPEYLKPSNINDALKFLVEVANFSNFDYKILTNYSNKAVIIEKVTVLHLVNFQ